MRKTMKIHSILLSLLLVSAALSGSAWALTASNTRIINNATLSYDDGTGTKTASASVTVTVALIPSAPVVAPGPPQTTPYTGPGTPLTNTFTVTAAANGPDTYDIASAISGAPTNTSGAAANIPVPASVTLGATVTMTGSTTTAIIVPADGSSNSSVNGIELGSTVVIGTETRTVASVTDNATGTSTINLAAALTAAPGAGILVAEQQTVQVVVTSGTITAPGTDITVAKSITVTSTTAPNPTVTSGTVTDTYTSGLATLTKYVRNATTASGSGTSITYGGNTYYLANVTAKPGETLEYLLVANNSGSGTVSSSTINDALPTTFVSLKTLVYSGSTRDVTYDNNGTVTFLTSAAADDQATYAASTLTVNIGAGATNALGGTIASGATVRVLYQTTVNP